MSTPTARGATLSGRLMRLGFADAGRAERMLTEDALVAVAGHRASDGSDADRATPVAAAAVPDLRWGDGAVPDDLLVAVGAVADPDGALLALARLAVAVRGVPARTELLRTMLRPGEPRDRLLAVLGASVALGDYLVAHPDELRVVADPTPGTGVPVDRVRGELLAAVGADAQAAVPVATVTGPAGVDAMRRAYRERLLRIAATDLTSAEPLTRLPGVAAALADLAGAALEASLALARADVPDGGAGVRIAVLGMGKCGGRELNYVSDVDVIYVVEPAEGHDEAYALSVGAKLAAGLARACSHPSAEPALWPVDAALRPEGKNGPLVRTLASHRAYYDRWARTWEFQALLKARPVAGDRALGDAYVAALNPLVWSAVGRENFVEDSQAMRRRVEDHVPAAEADRQLKLGVGGLRDVEFTVQLLQLVHGRADESIRSGNTLTALAALAAGGYVGREHAAQLAVCYRLLRALEHRIQLVRMQRTHLMPTAEADLRRLARAVGMRAEGAEGLTERWRAVRREVRSLHEELFYRPLLPATAQLSAEEASLAPDAARARLRAIGYRDPSGALRHISALTEGVSRRAAIQRQLLPVMLGWFADGADPDGGLLAFRRLSDELGTTHWYLKLLRDSGTAAYRLARVLSTSRYVADALARSPESVAWLGSDADLVPRGRERLAAEADAVLTRADEPVPAATALRALRRRELARGAAADLLDVVTSSTAAENLTAAADVVLAGGLRIAEAEARAEHRLDREPDDDARRGDGAARRPRDGLLLGRRRAVRARPAPRRGPAGRPGVRDHGRDPAADAARRRRPGAGARGRRRPAAGGTQRAARAVVRGVRGVLRAVVGAVGEPGAAAGAAGRRRRGAGGAVRRARRAAALPGRRPATRRWCGRSGGSRRGSRPSDCRAASTRPGTSSSVAAGSPTSSGPPSCSSCSTPAARRGCARRRPSRRSAPRPRRACSATTTPAR